MGSRNRLIDLIQTQGVDYQLHQLSGLHRRGDFPGECQPAVAILPDGRAAMFLVPAGSQVSPYAVQLAFGRPDARPAGRADLVRLFPDCDPDAVPAFGNWYGLPVYIDEELARADRISFPTGVAGEYITVPSATVERLSHAVRGSLAGLPLAALLA
jgi:prolyl-tRNA editing enzyme YbaK/EbsC (Cys-tRNA(Pro) deacylase)